MHKLQRGTAPTCLTDFHIQTHSWDDLDAADKVQIWQELETMQGQRCAYCEAQIERGKRHIEHFRQRSRFPRGTFEWNNLFGSCNRADSCGKHKDHCGPYEPADLVKPDVENPDHFFVFVADGTISVREGLNPTDRHRAFETLRILNLDERFGPLRHMRKLAVAGYLALAEDFRELAENFEPCEWMPELRKELELIVHLPFYTAIRHALEP